MKGRDAFVSINLKNAGLTALSNSSGISNQYFFTFSYSNFFRSDRSSRSHNLCPSDENFIRALNLHLFGVSGMSHVGVM